MGAARRTSLARLRAEAGERAEAHDLLAPVHGWFTEGFDTPDLIEAKALLEQLARARASGAGSRRRPYCAPSGASAALPRPARASPEPGHAQVDAACDRQDRAPARSRAIARAAARGSGAAVIGRPITRRSAPAASAAAGDMTRF